MAIEILLIGVIVLAALAIILLLFFFKKPYVWQKRIEGDKTIFSFEARKDIKMIELQVKHENFSFKRQNIKKGEKVEFVYKASMEPATLLIEEDGRMKTYEV